GLSGADLEAHHFWAVAGCYIKPGYLMPVVDFETNPGTSIADTSAWINRWCDDVVNYAALSGVTVRPLVYADHNHTPMLDNTVTGRPLWIAGPNGQDPNTGSPGVIAPWPSWTVWQYQF